MTPSTTLGLTVDGEDDLVVDGVAGRPADPRTRPPEPGRAGGAGRGGRSEPGDRRPHQRGGTRRPPRRRVELARPSRPPPPLGAGRPDRGAVRRARRSLGRTVGERVDDRRPGGGLARADRAVRGGPGPGRRRRDRPQRRRDPRADRPVHDPGARRSVDPSAAAARPVLGGGGALARRRLDRAAGARRGRGGTGRRPPG